MFYNWPLVKLMTKFHKILLLKLGLNWLRYEYSHLELKIGCLVEGIYLEGSNEDEYL